MADGQKWSISYTDVSNKKTVESFDSKGEAQSRYEALVPRTYGDLGDLIEVTAPVQSALGVQESARDIRWDDLGQVVREYLTGFYPTASRGDYRVEDLDSKFAAVIVDDRDGKSLFAIDDDYNNDDRGIVRVINLALSPKEFDRVFDLVKRSSKSTANALGINPDRYPIDVVKADKDEDCGGASAASLEATPTGVVGQDDTSRKDEAANPIAAIYGDGGINTYQHSADGFFAEKTHPIGFAILTNDTDTLSDLYHCDAVPPKDAYQYVGWSEVEDDDGNYDGYEYNWNDGYEKEFLDDWQRVIGETPNEDALKLMLSFDPDFFVCPADFSNALHAGYDRDILKKLFYNVRAMHDDDDDLRINYFGDSDYVSDDSPDPIANLEAFLGASESCKSEALPPKPWNGKTRKFPSRAALVKKAKELRATEIGDFDDYTKKNKDLFLDKIGFAMDINGNSVARLWWGENDGKYYYSTSRDVLDRTV